MKVWILPEVIGVLSELATFRRLEQRSFSITKYAKEKFAEDESR